MATLNITPFKPAAMTGVETQGGLKGAGLKWDAQTDAVAYQIYHDQALKNTFYGGDRDSATLLATVASNFYVPMGLDGSYNHFFWIKPVNAYNTEGDFYNPVDNSIFAGLKLTLWAGANSSATISINSIKLGISYLTSDGNIVTNAPASFTTAITNGAYSGVAWTNPNNARVQDSSYATVTLNNSESSNLVCNMSDFSIPTGAKLLGLTVAVTAKTTDYTTSSITVRFYNDNFRWATRELQFINNNTDSTYTYGSTSDLWSLDGLRVTQDVIYSVDTVDSVVSAGSSSIGSSTSSPTVTNYGQWYSGGSAVITPTINDIVHVDSYIISTISSVSVTSGQSLKVWVRARLYDNTTSTTVPGGTSQRLLYSAIYAGGVVSYGSLVNITNFNDTFIVGFRGLMTAGHSYSVFYEVMKQQVSGTPTCSLTINSTSVSNSSSANVT